MKQISSMSRKNVETVYDAVSVEGLLHRTRKLVETNCPKNVELKEENIEDEMRPEDMILEEETETETTTELQNDVE